MKRIVLILLLVCFVVLAGVAWALFLFRQRMRLLTNAASHKLIFENTQNLPAEPPLGNNAWEKLNELLP